MHEIARISLVTAALAIGACGDKPNEPATTETAMPAPFSLLPADPPIAEKRPIVIEQHGIKRTDNYAWMRDEDWQEVLRDPGELDADIREHLDAENVFYGEATGDLKALRDQLFEEMRGRIKEDDSTVPATDGEYAYAVRYREGGEYPIYVRTPRDGGEETILYDGDIESEGEDFFRIAAVSHSPDHDLVAYSVDRLGSEYYDIRIRTIATGEEYVETIPSTDGNVVWTANSKSFYYVERDDNQRPKRVKHHLIGTESAADLLVYEELDDSFFLGIAKSRSGEYILIGVGKGTSSEYRFLRADAEPGTEPTLIAPRLNDERYYVEHAGDYFYIRTNTDNSVDFKIVRAPVSDPVRENWEDWLPHEVGTYISGFVLFQDRIVLLERENALPRIVVSDYEQVDVYEIEFDEGAYYLGLSSGYESDTSNLRFTYESPSTPKQTFDFDMESRARVLRKSQEVPSGHDAELYVVERFFITADDGAEVPVTVLRLKSTPIDGTAPLLLYGYGSYGSTIQARFSTSILSVVERGVVYATAHIRGGAGSSPKLYDPSHPLLKALL